MRDSSIKKIANKILENNPDVVIQYRILKNILRSDDREINQVRQNLWNCPQVIELQKEQQADGGWGRFHTLNSKQKKIIPTTEIGIERAHMLGLDLSHIILKNAGKYINKILGGEIAFPDYEEANSRWPIGKKLFLSSVLSTIVPNQSYVIEERNFWAYITRRVFQSGQYSWKDEEIAHLETSGIPVKDSYLSMANKYLLLLLSSEKDTLPLDCEKALLHWISKNSQGIRYLNVPISSKPKGKPSEIERWLTSLELLSRFNYWRDVFSSQINWLIENRNSEGFWDLGPRPQNCWRLPLSSSWRKRINRQFDWSTRILLLISRSGFS